MPDNDAIRERGRSLEDDYFRKKDRELVEKMRRAGVAEELRKGLSASSGLQDPELIAELEALGFTPDTVMLLPFVPIVQMAWAEGSVSDAERKLITQLARSRGITEGSVADGTLTDWLDRKPSPDLYDRRMRLARAVLAAPLREGALTADDLVKYCEEVAAASGGIFGINKISAEERQMLSAIAQDLKEQGRP
jgi:hypothetical protein